MIATRQGRRLANAAGLAIVVALMSYAYYQQHVVGLEPGLVAAQHPRRRAARQRPDPPQRVAGAGLGAGAWLQRRPVQRGRLLGDADEEPVQERPGVAVPPPASS